MTATPQPVTLVLGGARSGKSRFAETLAEAASPLRLYVATAQAWDDEMRARIDLHRARRGEGWETVDAPLDLVGAIREHAQPARPVLVDCLTLWLTNLMIAARDIDAESNSLVEALEEAAGPVILVSNEVGLGIVPENAMARAFRDHAGRLHQSIAAAADAVYFIAAGLPLKMKG